MIAQNGSSGHKFKFLEQLSVENLECLLCLSSDAEETEAFLDAVAEVIAEKEKEHPTGRLPSVDDAWNEFQTLYQNHSSEHMPPDDDKEDDQKDQEEEDPILTPRKSVSRLPRRSRRSLSRRLWTAATVLITVALTVGCMVGVQATGLNVFGALAEWTDEFFHFAPAPSDRDRIRNALKEQGIPEELAPAWVPERFELEKVEPRVYDGGNSINAEYVDADGSLHIQITKYDDSTHLINWDYQKDSPDAEPFVSHKRQFYIISNEGDTTATWSDSQALLINLWGNVSAEEMMDIISSIGG